MVPPSIPGPSRAVGLGLEEAKSPSVRLATPNLPWSSSKAKAQAPSPSKGPSTAPWEASPTVTSLDLPVMAMLRAPKLWLLPHPTPFPSQASGVKGHSEAMATAPSSTVSETQASPQDPIIPEVYSLPSSLDLTRQGGEAMFLTFGGHKAGSPTASSQVATDIQAGASPNSPRADFGEIGGASPTGLSRAEHPRSSPQASLDRNVAVHFTPVEMATEPIGVRGISGSESEVFSTAESPNSSSQATVDEAQGTWPSLHSKGLGPHLPSAPSGGSGVSLIPGVTPNLESWAATDRGATVGPTDSMATLDPSDPGGIWEPRSHVVAVAENPTLSPLVSVDTSVVMSLMSLGQGDKVGVLATPTMASSSSQAHPEPEGQMVTQGTLGALAPPHEGSPPWESALPAWTPMAASTDEPVSVSSGEPTVRWDSPSTLPPAPQVLDEFEVEVLAGSAGVEEAASGEEPALPGTPANGSAEQSKFKAHGLIPPTMVGAWRPGVRGPQNREEGLFLGAREGF